MAQHDTGYKLLFAHKEMVRDPGPDSLRLDPIELLSLDNKYESR